MKKPLWTLGLALVGLVAFACSDTGRSTSPVAPESSNLSVVTGAVQAKTLICHHNPDIDDGDPEWVTIEVANGSKYLSKHPDDCQLDSGVVGEECSCEVTTLSSLSAGARSNNYPVTLCHNNPDWETDGGYLWEVIQVDDNASGKHIAKHGDYTTGTCTGLGTLAVGDDCGCCSGSGCDI